MKIIKLNRITLIRIIFTSLASRINKLTFVILKNSLPQTISSQETILRQCSESYNFRDSILHYPISKILFLIISFSFTTACQNTKNRSLSSESVTELCQTTKNEIRELFGINREPLKINSKLDKFSLRETDSGAALSDRFSNLCSSIYSWENFFKTNERTYICRINVDNIENHGQFDLMLNPENREKLKDFLGSEIPEAPILINAEQYYWGGINSFEILVNSDFTEKIFLQDQLKAKLSQSDNTLQHYLRLLLYQVDRFDSPSLDCAKIKIHPSTEGMEFFDTQINKNCTGTLDRILIKKNGDFDFSLLPNQPVCLE